MVTVGGDLFIQLGLVIIAAAFFATVFKFLKQPQILSYILVGILITPIFGIITDTSLIESMSMIGIAFLLFLVGLEMDLKKLKQVTLISTLGAPIQITFLFVTAFLIALALGFLPLEAIYMGLMFAFSSTMIVMKILSDRKELSTLHGRIIVGILLMEDIFAVFALSILTSINGFNAGILGHAFLKFLLLVGVAYVASKYVFPKYFEFTAKKHELLLISSLGVCFLFSLAFHYLGFSIVIGAFAAGLTLGNLRYQLEIIGRMKPLRDFFALLFFVSLGMTLKLNNIIESWPIILAFTLFVIVFKPLLVIVLASVFRYTKKPSLYSGLYLTQVGEFALIIGMQGLLLGHISDTTFTTVVIISLLTLTFTSYYVKFMQQIYNLVEKPLRFLNRFNTEGLEFAKSDLKPNVVLCGHNRIGYSILRKLGKTKKSKEKILVVDYNPEIIKSTAKRGFHCIYGEVDDEEIIEKMNLSKIKLLISTVPGLKENLLLTRKVRKVNKKAKVIATAQSTDDAMALYKAGADYVTLPHFLGGDHIANLITGVRKKAINLNQRKEDHLKELKLRQKHGHDHPSYFY